MKLYTKFFCIFALFMLSSCSMDIPLMPKADPNEASQNMQEFMKDKDEYKKLEYVISDFPVLGYQRITNPDAPLFIYIGDDGEALAVKRPKPEIREPKSPTALKLALLDGHDNVIWLARPCHYENLVMIDEESECEERHYRRAAYSDDMIAIMVKIVDDIASKHKTKQIHLIGYRGGATMAVMMAESMTNIRSIRTIAGILDMHNWREQQGAIRLSMTADAISKARLLKYIPQFHFIGGDDDDITPWMAQKFVDRGEMQGCASVRLIEDVEDEDEWLEFWSATSRILPQCETPN